MVGHHIGRVNILKDFSPVHHQDVFSPSLQSPSNTRFLRLHSPHATIHTCDRCSICSSLSLSHTHARANRYKFRGGCWNTHIWLHKSLKPYYGFSTLSTLERFFPSFHIKILVSCSVFEDFCSSPFIVYAIVLTISKVRILLFTKSSNRNR